MENWPFTCWSTVLNLGEEEGHFVHSLTLGFRSAKTVRSLGAESLGMLLSRAIWTLSMGRTISSDIFQWSLNQDLFLAPSFASQSHELREWLGWVAIVKVYDGRRFWLSHDASSLSSCYYRSKCAEWDRILVQKMVRWGMNMFNNFLKFFDDSPLTCLITFTEFNPTSFLAVSNFWTAIISCCPA